MPLRPTIPGTNQPKPFADYSEEELRHHAQQVADEQMNNRRWGAPIDHGALKHAGEIAASLKAKDLAETVASAKAFVEAPASAASKA